MCDCNISWFLESVKKTINSHRIVDLESLKCSSPEHLRSRYLSQLNKEDICTPSVKLSQKKDTSNTSNFTMVKATGQDTMPEQGTKNSSGGLIQDYVTRRHEIAVL